MMKITDKLKERFCKDCNIPIKYFESPFFERRLELYDPYYGSLKKWEIFLNELKKYNSEQDYFEEYNRVKDMAIYNIKESLAYQKFNSEDMNKFAVPERFRGLPSKDIFKPSNTDKEFLSVDLRKANFSALRNYSLHNCSNDMFGGVDTWEKFVGRFTENQHIINSKYIRQVILGNCNPKRHITYEKYLMSMVLQTILTDCLGKVEYDLTPYNHIVFFSNDEVIFDISDMSLSDEEALFNVCYEYTQDEEEMRVLPVKVKVFNLYKIEGADGYTETILKSSVPEEEGKIEFKCVDGIMLPFILRALADEEIQLEDRFFMFDGRKRAMFLDNPTIII
jgi:hypothetical protein